MADEESRTAGEIETLLATRQRISEWLHRLGQASSEVPPGVRDGTCLRFDVTPVYAPVTCVEVRISVQ